MLGLQLSRTGLGLESKDSRKSVTHSNLTKAAKLYKSMDFLNEQPNTTDMEQMLKTLESNRLSPAPEGQRKSRAGGATGQSQRGHAFVPAKEAVMFQQADAAYAKGDYETSLLLFHKLRRMRPNSQRYQMGILKTNDAIKENNGVDANSTRATEEDGSCSGGPPEDVDSSDADSHPAASISCSTSDLATGEAVKIRRKKGRHVQLNHNYKVAKDKFIESSSSQSTYGSRKKSMSDKMKFLHTAMSDEMLDQLERMLNRQDEEDHQTMSPKKSDSDETLKNCWAAELEVAVQSSSSENVNHKILDEASKIIVTDSSPDDTRNAEFKEDDSEASETVSSKTAETIRPKKPPTPKRTPVGASALAVRQGAVRSYLSRQARALETALHSSDVEAIYRTSRHMLQYLEKQKDDLVPYKYLLRQYIYHHLAMADVHRNNFEGALSWLDSCLGAPPFLDAAACSGAPEPHACAQLEATLACATLMARARVHAARRHPRRAAAALAELMQTAPAMRVSPERQLLIDTWLHHDLGWCYLEVDDILSASGCARACLSRAEALGAAVGGVPEGGAAVGAARWAAAARVLLARCHARAGAASEARSELRLAVKLARVAGDQKLANFAEASISEIRDRRPGSGQVRKRDAKPR